MERYRVFGIELYGFAELDANSIEEAKKRIDSTLSELFGDYPKLGVKFSICGAKCSYLGATPMHPDYVTL